MADKEPVELEQGPFERTMKPMLSACVQEAVHLALIDSVSVPFRDDSDRTHHGYPTLSDLRVERDDHPENFPQDDGIDWDDDEVLGRLLANDRPANDAERAAWAQDIYAIPDEALARMDLGALARNVSLRLLGTGGWTLPAVPGVCDGKAVYSGNATKRDVFEATFARPDYSAVDEFAFDLQRHLNPDEDEDR